MSKESFLVFKSFYEPIKLLSNEDLGQLFRQIFEYQISGTEPTNTSRTFMVFQFFKNQFRLDDVKYQAVCERNKGNGAKGGRKPKPTEPNPKNPVGLKEPKQPDNEKEKDNDKYLKFIDWFNGVMGKKYRGDKTSEGQFNARIKDGYVFDNFKNALLAIKQDKFHIENNYKYLTPEFLTRPAQLEKWSNFKLVAQPNNSSQHDGLL